MAISWDTYITIPTLLDYAAAKKHHDDIVPIRGDAEKTRPCARRDQKWFSIWEAEGAIHVGYSNRTKLVTYEPSGSIMVHSRGRGCSAATNERISKLLKAEFQTYQYDVWVRCAFYDNGEGKGGWMQLRHKEPSMFLRNTDGGLTFMNYKFPVTHQLNKVKVKEILRPFLPFITYMDGIAKLQDAATARFNTDTIAEVFGWADEGRKQPNRIPQLRWGNDVEHDREEFFRLAVSDDHYDRLKAAITLSNAVYYGDNTRTGVMEQIMRGRPNDIFDKKEHRDGKFVKDRYRRFVG